MLIMDGGGKVRGALRPILGPDRILTLFHGLILRGYLQGDLLPVDMNGQIGLLLVRKDHTKLAFGFGWDSQQDRIKRIFVVSNPDKLKHIAL